MKKRRFLSACSLLLSLALLTSLPAARTPEGYARIDDGAERLLEILESLPYAVEGSGPVVWMFEFSECPYCQAKRRDFRGQNLGLEFRRVFVPVNPRSAREAAALGKSRDPRDYHLFMDGRKAAPPIERDNEAIDIHNAIIKAASQDIPPILKRNGWAARGLVFPAYFWIENGQLMANGGYTKENFLGAVARAKSGWNDASRAYLASAGGSGTDAPSVQVAASTGSGPGTAPSQAARASPEQAKPLDSLTALFVYHKLADEPLDFELIARNTYQVYRADAFDKDKVAAEVASNLRRQFEAADPTASYTITLRAQMQYDMNQQRYDVDTFRPGLYIPMVPFRPHGGGVDLHHLSDNRLAARYDRRLAFLNAHNARYLPLATAQAGEISPGGSAVVAAEVAFRLVDTEDSVVDNEKTVRAEISSVRYTPATGRMTASWPFQEPIAVAAAKLPPAGEGTAKIDDFKAFFLYHKLSGEPIDYDAIGPMLDKVARAGQFDKANVMAEEINRLKAGYAAADPEATYALRVGTSLKYDLENERFGIEIFEPGRHMLYQPMNGLLSRRFLMQAGGQYVRKLVFANGESARYIPIPRDEAAQIGHVAQHGSTSASADIEFRLVGTGDPTGAVEGSHILQAEIVSLRFPDLDWDIPVKPYDPAALPVKPVSGFDIVGLKTGIPLTTLQRTIEKEFGPVGAIRPSRGEDPRLISGVGHNTDGCYTFGNKVAQVGNVCIQAYADEKGVVRKIVVEQILEGAEWDPIREALLSKYGAMSAAVSRGNNRYYAWGPEIPASLATDERVGPSSVLTARLSAVQSAMDRMAASTRVSTNLRIRLIDAAWAGPPEPPAPPAAQPAGPAGPRL